MRATTSEAWHATRSAYGSATLHLVRTGSEIMATAFGPAADWVLERVPALLGVDDDPIAFDSGPGVLRDLHGQSLGLRLGATGSVFDALVPTVVAQQVTSKEARASYRRLLNRYGEKAPGPADLTLVPHPERLAEIPYWELHRLGIERRRAAILAESGRRAKRLEEIVDMDRGDAMKRLLAIEGIGPWTAAHVMGAAWGDRDAVPIGDYHLPNTVSWALDGEPRADDRRMLELLEPFKGNRRRVVLLLAGTHAPRYGPRAPIRDIDGI